MAMGTCCRATADIRTCSRADSGHVLVSCDTSLDADDSGTRILASPLCSGVAVTGLRAHAIHLGRKRNRLPKWRFFPEPTLQEVSTRDLPLGKEVWMRASIDSHIFETSTRIFMAKCCTRLTEFHDSTSSVVFAMPVHSEAKWRFVLPHLSCHKVLPSQLIGKTVSVCVETRLPTSLSVSATRNLILASRSSGFTKPETNVPSQRDGDLVRLARGLVLGRYVQDPSRVDVESDFNLRQATWRWREPIEIELPKRIGPQSSRTLL